MAAMNALLTLPVSREAELDRQIEDLIAKMVAGDATDSDKRLYSDLASRRLRMMQSSSSARYSKSRVGRQRWGKW